MLPNWRDPDRPRNEVLQADVHDKPIAPLTAIEAIMQCGIGEPEESAEEREARMLPLRAAIERAMLVLDERERDLVSLHAVGGVSFRNAAPLVGLEKSHAHRIVVAAFDKLRVALLSEPEILAHLRTE